MSIQTVLGFTYNGIITFEGTCKETGKPIHIEKRVEYFAGTIEPDTQKLMMKILRKGSAL
jgi:hypothetical protein